jgi:ferredoxin
VSDKPEYVHLVVDGRNIKATAGTSLLQAWIEAGQALVDNVGCMGQGVCGACRVLVRAADSDAVTTALACETPVAAGMQVSFIDYFPARRRHTYVLDAMADGSTTAEDVARIFPEAPHCRHCSGCDRACPRGIEVEKMVERAVAGDLAGAASPFDHCVMCNLCVAACPEHIDPAHLGQFVRRQQAAATRQPHDLQQRLAEIEAGQQPIDPVFHSPEFDDSASHSS